VVGFVKTYTKVPLTTEQEEDEDADVYEAHTRCTTDYTRHRQRMLLRQNAEKVNQAL
jgi:hypothetical protein